MFQAWLCSTESKDLAYPASLSFTLPPLLNKHLWVSSHITSKTKFLPLGSDSEVRKALLRQAQGAKAHREPVVGVLLEGRVGPSEDTPVMDLKEELAFRSRHRKGSAWRGLGIRGHSVCGGRKLASWEI